MTIAYVNAGTRTQTSGNTSLTPSLPGSRVNGNFLTAMRMSKDGSTHTCADTTWTKIAESKSGTSQSVSIWFRLVDGTEAAPTIVSGNSPGSAIIYQRSRPNFNNSDIADMVGAISANSGSGATHTSTGIVTTRDNSFVAYFDCGNANTALATPSGWTENSDQGNSTGASRSTTGSKTVATTGGNSGDISVIGATGAWNQIQIEFLDAAIPAAAYRITDTADDRYSSDSALGSDVTSIIVGDIGSLHKAGVRFLAIDAEQGATVVSAILYHKQLDVYDPVGAPKVHAVPGPCAAWTTTSPSAATLTTASADLSYASGAFDAWMETDVTALVQEAINDGSWTTGSALGLVLSDPTAPLGGAIEIYDYLSGAENGAGLYLEVEAGVGPITGTLDAQESGTDSLTGSGDVTVTGALSSDETGTDSFAGTGTVVTPSSTGTLATQEVGSDTYSGAGTVSITAVLGTTETGSDSLTGSGTVAITGTLVAIETGSDTYSGAATVTVTAVLAAQESGTDSLTATGTVAPIGIVGALAVIETGSDTYSGVGTVSIAGTLAAVETGSDGLIGSGTVAITGTLTAIETGSDTLSASGAVAPVGIVGSMLAVEAGSDVLTATGDVGPAPITGTLTTQETGADACDVVGTVDVIALLVARESGADSFAADLTAAITGTFGATETGSDVLTATGFVIAGIVGAMVAIETGSDQGWHIPATTDSLSASQSRASASGQQDRSSRAAVQSRASVSALQERSSVAADQLRASVSAQQNRSS